MTEPLDKPADLSEAVRNRLLGDDAVSSLVGESVLPEAIGQNEGLPAIRYRVLADRRPRRLNGPGSMRQLRLEVTAIADSQDLANRVSREAERLLDGFSGVMRHNSDAGAGGVWVNDCSLENAYTRHDDAASGQGRTRHRRVIDFLVSCQHLAYPLPAAA